MRVTRSFSTVYGRWLHTVAWTLLLAAPIAAAETRTGWHGETLPAGLVKGEQQGEYVWKKDGSIMVWVPAGSFRMGSERGHTNEQPIHEVWLDGFYIDKYEVTWRQWKASGLPWAEEPSGQRSVPEPPDWGIREDDPVLHVDWRDAQKYAAVVGKRLPTEAEWEKAARGTDGREFPWGNSLPTLEQAMWMEHPVALDFIGSAVCCQAGASPYGAVNLAGNAQEWVEDVYDPFFYKRSPAKNPVNREGKVPLRRVLRGGAFVHEVEALRSAAREYLYEFEDVPYVGFRMALSGAAGE